MNKHATLSILVALIATPSAALAQSVTEPPPVPLAAQTRATHEPESRFRVALDADAGYGTYLSVFDGDEAAHGMMANVGLSLTWGSQRRRYGMRFNGMYAPRLSPESMSASAGHYARVAAVHMGFLADFGGLWLSPAVGMTFMSQMKETAEDSGVFDVEKTLPLPEFNLAFGYNIPVGRSLDLTLRADAGNVFFIIWKFSASAGLRVKF